MRRLLWLLVVVAVAGLALIGWWGWRQYYFGWWLDDYDLVQVQLKEQWWAPVQRELTVEVVKSPAALTAGLSRRTDLVSKRDGTVIDGVLFLFSDQQVRHFWMHEMQFAIDICWLAWPKILSCARNAPAPAAGEVPARFQSALPVSVVLETRPAELSETETQLKLFFK